MATTKKLLKSDLDYMNTLLSLILSYNEDETANKKMLPIFITEMKVYLAKLESENKNK